MDPRRHSGLGFALILAALACLSGGCGGIGDGASATTDAGAASPAVASHAWDSWNWDEGSFGD
jgi:hypothetical protein